MMTSIEETALREMAELADKLSQIRVGMKEQELTGLFPGGFSMSFSGAVGAFGTPPHKDIGGAKRPHCARELSTVATPGESY
jgi:hypothetical protein